MELHQLRYFLAVADEGTFTAAASAARVSQSGISTQVQKLEHELGLPLIDRSSRRVALTPAGERIAVHARLALAAVRAVAEEADGIRGLVTGSLRVATVTGLAWPPFFDALAAIHAQHPGIDVRLAEGTSADLIAQVRDGNADLAVAGWAGPDPDGVNAATVFDDPLRAAVGANHPWAAREAVTAQELAGADLICLPAGTGARDALDRLLAGAGTPATPRWEVATPAFVQLLASRGLGVGIASATTMRDWDGLTRLRIGDDTARSRLGIIWGTAPSHATRALLAELACTR